MLFLFLALGVPVAFALGISGFVWLTIAFGLPVAFGYLKTTPYREAAHYGLATLPLFLLMGYIASRSGITNSLFIAAYRWVGHLPGGLAQATILAAAVFAAACGSSIASAAALSPVVLPEMEKFNYDKTLAMGTVAASGTFAIMIPPSVALIVYATLTELSVGKLFIAGIIPGILSAFLYLVSIAIRAKLNPALAPPAPSFTNRERLISLGGVWPIGIIIFIVIGGIYLGVMTPTEAGAVGALGAIAVGLGRRQLSMDNFNKSILDSAKTAAMIFMIIIGAFIFGYYLTLAKIPQTLIAFLAGLPLVRWIILVFILILYIILGTFMDQMAIICLTTPIIFPVIVGLGYNPIWWGIILVKTAEIGLITPPLGLNVYIIQGVTKEPLAKVFRGILPFFLVDLFTLTLLVTFPQITLFLPETMG